MIKRGFQVGIAVGIAAMFVYTVPNLHHAWLKSKILNSVAMITRADLSFGGGTGFQVETPSGHQVTLTNAHICRMQAPPTFAATWKHGIALIKKIYQDDDADLCALSPINGTNALTLSDSQGDTVNIVGFPHLEPPRLAHGDILGGGMIEIASHMEIDDTTCPTDKIVNDLFDLYCLKEYRALSTDARTYPGNSGSPSTDWLGRVNGVLFAGSQESVTSYVIPLDVVSEFLREVDIELQQVKNRQNGKKAPDKTNTISK